MFAWGLHNLLALFMIIHGSMGMDDDSFVSLCDHQTDLNSTWNINNGFFLQAWTQSIIPSDTFGNGGKATFKSRATYMSVSDVLSLPARLRWKAYGDKYLDGWLYGQTDTKGNFKPKETVYIFPDFKTALIGTFENSDRLIEGVETKVTHFRCHHGVMELKIRNPSDGSTKYSSHRPSLEFFSPYSKMRDPLDKKNVYVGPSAKYPEMNGEDSLYARRAFAPHMFISYYLGYFMEPSNIYANYTVEFQKNLLSYNDSFIMNLPVEAAHLENFRSVLGHKVNHDFEDSKVIFGYTKHPIYGEIRCLVSNNDIIRGEEIFANYGYLIDQEKIPRWYTELYKRTYSPDSNK